MDFFSSGRTTAFFRFCGKVPEVIDRFMMSWRDLLIFMSADTSSDLISHEGQGSSGQVVGLTEVSTLVTSERLRLLKLSRVESRGSGVVSGGEQKVSSSFKVSAVGGRSWRRVRILFSK